MSNYSLEDKIVKIFLLGSHEVQGFVEFLDSEKLVIRDELNRCILIQRDKIVATMILEKNSYGENISAETTQELRGTFLQEEHYSSSIPSDMLIDGDEDDDDYQVSFSMTLPPIGKFSNNEGDYSSDSEKENELSGKKDKGEM